MTPLTCSPPILAQVPLGYAPHIILALYLCMLLTIAVVGLLRSRISEEDFFLAGRKQGVIVSALTIMATMFSSGAFLGVSGWIYKDGVAPMLFALNLPLSGAAVYIFGSRFSRLGRHYGYVTPADLIADYYNRSATLRILVALVGFLYVLPYVVMQIKAGGYLAQRMFPDAPPIHIFGREYSTFDSGVTALSLMTMIYVLLGGMRCVAWTDVIQGILLLGGMLLASTATIYAMGGPTEFFHAISNLPREALSLPGPSGAWSPWKLMTLCMFASLATMIQPAQWMRYYAARSTRTLARSALIFAIVLPSCFLFGVMLVALGGRAMYPPTVSASGILPHPAVGSQPAEVDQIVIVMIQNHIPELFGAAGIVIVSLILVAVLAASMSTADSNLHALSAVITRDIYDRFLRPKASQRERAWVGRIVIIIATLAALWLVNVGEQHPDFKPIQMIGQMMIVAMAFSCQLLPMVLDILFIRRGSRAGAIAGVVAGLTVVMLFTPLPDILAGNTAWAQSLDTTTNQLRRLFDIGFIGFIINAAVFTLISFFTRAPQNAHTTQMRNIMDNKPSPNP